MTHEPDAEVVIVYPPSMLPSPDEDSEADVIVDGVIIYSTDGGNMDWADEKAAAVIGLWTKESRATVQPIFAMALRKAKADGMREAMGLIDGITTESDEAGAVLYVYWKRIFNAVQKLESPTD